MLIRPSGFNLYLLAVVALIAICGCQSTETKLQKQTAVFRLHLEDRSSDTNHSRVVPVYRSAPVMIPIQKAPILTENQVRKASVVESMGGFQMQVQFNRQGSLLLEQYTSGNPNQHLIIFCNFTSPTNLDVHLDRWLAAPRIGKRITSGLITFTPDATREESDLIANSLNNVSKKNGNDKEP